jgi:prepilin-type processing-associated H-X9-DG protein
LWTPGDKIGQKIGKVKDGVSKTILGTEVRTLDRTWDQRGAWALPWGGATLLSLDWHPVNEANASPNQIYVPIPGYENAQLPNRTERIFDQVVVCKEPLYAKQQKMPCQKMTFNSAAPRSLHPGGVNAVALDGHVGFISDEIDSYVFAYLVSSNDGQSSDVTEYMR